MSGGEVAPEPSGRVTCPWDLLAREGEWLAQEMARVAVERWREAWREAGREEPPVGQGSMVLSTSEDYDARMVTLTVRYREYGGDL